MRGFEDFPSERRRAAVVDMLHAQRTEIGLFRGACRGMNLGPRGLHQLDCRQSHPAGAGVDEYFLSSLQSRILEGQRGRYEGAGNGGEPGDRESRRRGRHEFRMCDHLRSEGAEAESHHVVARGDGRYFGAHLCDIAAHLPAQQALFDETEGPEDVPEIESGRLDGDADFPGFEGTRRERLHVGFVEDARRVRSQHPVRIFRKVQAIGFVSYSDQPRHHPAFPPVDDVILVVGVQEFVDEIGGRRHLRGVQIQHPGLQMGRFAGYPLAESPQGGACHFAAEFPFQHLRPARNEPDPSGRDRIGFDQSLHEREGAGAGTFHVLRHFSGGGLRTVAIQPREMHYPVEWHILRQAFDQRSPRFPLLVFRGGPDDTRAASDRPYVV